MMLIGQCTADSRGSAPDLYFCKHSTRGARKASTNMLANTHTCEILLLDWCHSVGPVLCYHLARPLTVVSQDSARPIHSGFRERLQLQDVPQRALQILSEPLRQMNWHLMRTVTSCLGWSARWHACCGYPRSDQIEHLLFVTQALSSSCLIVSKLAGNLLFIHGLRARDGGVNASVCYITCSRAKDRDWMASCCACGYNRVPICSLYSVQCDPDSM